MTRILFAFSLFILLLSSCNKEDDFKIPDPVPGPIDWLHPQVGQANFYLRLRGERYFDPNNTTSWGYLPDTLLLEIVDADENGYLIRESLTSGSYSFTADTLQLFQPDSIAFYYLNTGEDTVRFFHPDQPFLLSKFPVLNHAYPLEFFTANPTSFAGWKTELPYCECNLEAYVDHAEILGRKYGKLNVLIENMAMQYDGPGFTTAYNASEGIVRTYVVNWWFQMGEGWDLLPHQQD